MANSTPTPAASLVTVDPRATPPASCSFPCYAQNCAHAVAPFRGRFVITMAHAGFNSPANNRNGYTTEAAARKAVRGYSMPAPR